MEQIEFVDYDVLSHQIRMEIELIKFSTQHAARTRAAIIQRNDKRLAQMAFAVRAVPALLRRQAE